MSQVIVIAEIGENHLGDMSKAKYLIKEAALAGAHYAKFQSYLPGTFKKTDPEYDWFCKVSLSDDAHRVLKAYAEECGISFLSAPFSEERARFLCETLGIKAVKVASGMMMNTRVLDYIDQHAETVFLSTGMATIPEIREAVMHLSHVKNLYVLHCVTQYPATPAMANLLAIPTLQETFPQCIVGYSDHTIGPLAAYTAVALGAKVIEKHFTFDKGCSEGTDHVLSATPEELSSMIRDMNIIDELRGHGNKIPHSEEEKIRQFVRARFVETLGNE